VIVKKVLSSSRFFIAIAVVGAFLSSVVLLLAGVVAVGEVAWDAIREPRTDVEEAEHLAVDFIQLIDVFLLGTVLYIISLGLYELFVDPDLPMPSWLRIHDFEDLKVKVIGVIVVLLGVTFLGSAVTWQGGKDILYFGAAIGLVIVALAFVMLVFARTHGRHGEAPDESGA
jgi:uncharacterized membrane protein YqhA